jgi:Fe-S-cluster-containing dehydrogenase component
VHAFSPFVVIRTLTSEKIADKAAWYAEQRIPPKQVTFWIIDAAYYYLRSVRGYEKCALCDDLVDSSNKDLEVHDACIKACKEDEKLWNSTENIGDEEREDRLRQEREYERDDSYWNTLEERRREFEIVKSMSSRTPKNSNAVDDEHDEENLLNDDRDDDIVLSPRKEN